MAKRLADRRQADFFGDGEAGPHPSEPVPRRRERQTVGQTGDKAGSAAQPSSHAEAGLAERAARATPSELDELVHALPDDGLAHLSLASVRALRRRLARSGPGGARGRKGRAGPLERAARQLAAELGGTADDEP